MTTLLTSLWIAACFLTFSLQTGWAAESLESLREQAFEVILEWSRTHRNQFPGIKQFGPGRGQIPLNYERLTGTGVFKARARRHEALFEDSQQCWLSFQQYAAQKGVRVKLIHLPIRTPLHDETRRILQEEANETIFNWIQDHDGVMPGVSDFGFAPGQIPIAYHRLMGTFRYAPTKEAAGQSLFPNTQRFWYQFYHYAKEKGLKVSLLRVRLRGDLSDEIRELLQEQACEVIVQWVKAHNDQFPTPRDFGYEDGKIPIHYCRVTGISTYRPGHLTSGSAIFQTYAQYKDKIEEQLRPLKTCDPFL